MADIRLDRTYWQNTNAVANDLLCSLGFVRVRWDESMIHTAYDPETVERESLNTLMRHVRSISRPMEMDRFIEANWNSDTYLRGRDAVPAINADARAVSERRNDHWFSSENVALNRWTEAPVFETTDIGALIRHWEEHNGVVSAAMHAFISRLGLAERSVVCKEATDGRVYFTSVGSEFSIDRHLFANMRPGRLVADQLDPSLGLWVESEYLETMLANEPRIVLCSGIVHLPWLTERREWTRLVLPCRSNSRRQLPDLVLALIWNGRHPLFDQIQDAMAKLPDPSVPGPYPRLVR